MDIFNNKITYRWNTWIRRKYVMPKMQAYLKKKILLYYAIIAQEDLFYMTWDSVLIRLQLICIFREQIFLILLSI